MLVDLETSGRLSPKWVCLLSYYAAAAGAKGPVKDFGLRPEAGHFSRHYDRVLNNLEHISEKQQDC
eukprot:5915283-Karenia_brevis.AAC.1